MRLNNECKELLLEHEFSAEEGWIQTDEVYLDDQHVEFVLKNDEWISLVISYPDDPFVSRQHLRDAVELQKKCSEMNGSVNVKVLLVYGELLMKPHALPSNISVASILTQATGTHDHFSEQ